MRAFFSLIIVVFLYSIQAYAGCTTNYTNTFIHQGTKSQQGVIDIIDLHGSYCDMGREYGYLEKKKLKQFYQSLYQYLIIEKHKDYKKLMKIANDLYRNYPQRFKNFFIGMSETSGLSLKQHLFINAFEHILYYKNPGHQPGCSSFAVWGPYTKNHDVLFGRNYDYFIGHPEFKDMVSITIFHPASGANATAMITFLGTLNATTLLNDHGLFLELNNAYPSGKQLNQTHINYQDYAFTTINLLAMMLDSSTLHDLSVAMHTYNTTFPFIINIADEHTAKSFEWARNKLQLLSMNKSNFFVSTNNFLDPSWHLKHTSNLWYSKERHDNLAKLVNSDKKTIGIKDMQSILEKNLFTEAGATYNKTVYQIIVQPKSRTLWMRLPGYSDHWQRISLAKYFMERGQVFA